MLLGRSDPGGGGLQGGYKVGLLLSHGAMVWVRSFLQWTTSEWALNAHGPRWQLHESFGSGFVMTHWYMCHPVPFVGGHMATLLTSPPHPPTPPSRDDAPSPPTPERCGHNCQPITYWCILCRIHGRSVAHCSSPKALGHTLTCIDADSAMHMMQISKNHNALHLFISYLPAPIAEQGQCKSSSCSPETP